MFKHILVPVDGSRTSQAAVGKALGLAQAFGSKVSAIYVIDPYPFSGVGSDFAYGQNEYLAAANAEANAAIRYAKESLIGGGVPVETHVVEGHNTWRGIVSTAESLHVDLIVMGSHGRSGIEKLVLGSVAQAVLTHTKLPVLIARA